MTDERRRIPGVDRVLAAPAVERLLDRYPRELVVESLREVLDRARESLARAPTDEAGPGADALDPDALDPDALDPDALALRVEALVAARSAPTLRRVINATGVILHTNLGRAPLSRAAVTAMVEAGRAYSNLEFDLDEGVRGSRYDHCRGLLRELTGAEDALVVNNAAAALILALDTAAAGRGVVVSRGELIEIGGGFRIPEIVERAGTELVEVGTTNRTRLDDYRAALDVDPGAVLKVHRSNFRVSGFTEEVPVGVLSRFAAEHALPLVYDLGSGLMVELTVEGLPSEPTVRSAVASGADLVLFSGDKLLGGPQAGLVVGRADWIQRLRKNPLCRALRVDKVTLAGLEATLRAYRDPEAARAQIPVLRMVHETADSVRRRSERMIQALEAAAKESGAGLELVAGHSVVGGGTLPDGEISTWRIALDPRRRRVDAVQRALRSGTIGVVARTDDDRVLFDLRTVDEAEEGDLIRAVRDCLEAGD